MAQNLDPNLNDPTQTLSRNDVNAHDERIHTVTPDEDDGIRTRNESEASASVEKDERIPTVTPYNENGIAGPDDDDDDDDTALDDDDDDDDYEEIVPIEGDEDDLEDEYDDEDDDEIEDRTNDSDINISRVGTI